MAPHLLLVSSLAFGNAETSKQSPTTITTKNWVLMDDECQRGCQIYLRKSQSFQGIDRKERDGLPLL
jgi:hypothetical protein